MSSISLLNREINTFDKFLNISKKLQEYILQNTTNIKKYDLIPQIKSKLEKRFAYYEKEKDFLGLESLISKATHNSLYDEKYINNLKQEVIMFAAKEDKPLALLYINKYKVKFTTEKISKILKQNNLEMLEILINNPEVKFDIDKSLTNTINIVNVACEKRKVEFLRFACILANENKDYFFEILETIVRKEWKQGVEFMINEYKENIAPKAYEYLANLSSRLNNLEITEMLTSVSSNLETPVMNNTVEKTMKQLREANFGTVNKNPVLKS